MFGIGGTEFIIILIFAFLIFGPDKLPKMAQTIGKFIRKFQETRAEVSKVVKEDVIDINDLDNPIKDPAKAVDKLSNIAKDTFKDVTQSASSVKEDASNSIASKAIADREKLGKDDEGQR